MTPQDKLQFIREMVIAMNPNFQGRQMNKQSITLGDVLMVIGMQSLEQQSEEMINFLYKLL